MEKYVVCNHLDSIVLDGESYNDILEFCKDYDFSWYDARGVISEWIYNKVHFDSDLVFILKQSQDFIYNWDLENRTFEIFSDNNDGFILDFVSKHSLDKLLEIYYTMDGNNYNRLYNALGDYLMSLFNIMASEYVFELERISYGEVA